ncbi:MAG: exodeoxyribonuclease VII large subunit, partial [Bacteroidota bacterium]
KSAPPLSSNVGAGAIDNPKFSLNLTPSLPTLSAMTTDAQPAEKKILSVTELTRLIKQSLETGFPRVWLQAEISNCKRHTSGHWYFTLKDEGSQISAVMWRSRADSLLFVPADGMKVQARGAITVYPPRGNYQIDVTQLLPAGVGELQMAFDRLKKKLFEEGLFDQSRKRPLPKYPERVGVITSLTGAALQDIRSVLQRRAPTLEVIVTPVRVQGPGAAEEIAEAIRAMNRYGGIEVLIVGRGGGSLEDLWPFNEEAVARAIAASTIPVISAVGHEVDFSIADFVADLRAPTPSVAAEFVIQHRIDLVEIVGNIHYTMLQRVQDRIENLRDRLKRLLSSYSFNRPKDLVLQWSQRIDELDKSLSLAALHLFESAHDRHVSYAKRLEALSPRNVVQRGYAIVRKGNRIVTTAGELAEGDLAEIQFKDDSLSARVERK